MESQPNCNKCSKSFDLESLPYELHCKHNLCYVCLGKAFNSKKNNIICPIEQQLFKMDIDEI